jgi:AcrR family transcriptional regulator
MQPNIVRVKPFSKESVEMVTSKRRQAPLTRDELFQRALAIADAEGLEALTMRRLASEVGVEAASLYHHVPNKDALLDGVVVRMRSELQIPDPLPEDWKDLMQAIFAEYRRVLAAHPNLMPLAGRRVETDPDSGLVFLTQLGFSDDDAVELWQSMIAFVVGFSVFGSAYAESDVSDLPLGLATRMTDWQDETCIRTLRMMIEGYDAAR